VDFELTAELRHRCFLSFGGTSETKIGATTTK
jgi:hypothetical protein